MDTLAAQIMQLLHEKPLQKASELAKVVCVSKKEVNLVLYRTLRGQVFQDAAHRWAPLDETADPTENEVMASTEDVEPEGLNPPSASIVEVCRFVKMGSAPPQYSAKPSATKVLGPVLDKADPQNDESQEITTDVDDDPDPEWPSADDLPEYDDGLLDYTLSLVRGVYNFDRDLKGIQDTDEFSRFIQNKLNFLPPMLRDEARQLSDDADLTLLSQSQVAGNQIAKRSKRFFKRHQYFEIALKPETEYANSDKYLEIKFVERVLTPLLTDNGLATVTPQNPIGPYFADFAIEHGNSRLAIEVDGFGKFQQREDLNQFHQRQNYLTNAGWRILRFTYSHIMETPEKTIAVLRAYLNQHEMRHLVNFGNPSDGSDSLTLTFQDDDPVVKAYASIEYVNGFYQIQDYFVSLLLNNPAADEIYLEDGFSSQYPIVALALSELFTYWDMVKPWVHFPFPDVSVKVIMRRIMEIPKSIHPKITVQSIGTGEILNPEVVRKNQRLEGFCRRIKPQCFRSVENVEQSQDLASPLLHFFFGYTKPHQFQNQIIREILCNKNVLGISATGSGKSMCFWLPALARPGLTIVVAPLKALMRDQKASLENKGIASVAFLNSDLGRDEKDAVMRQVVAGQIRLLYVAPERLRIKAFRAQLTRLQTIIPINTIAIDEAHCVSEWGHDFRPSYLKVRSLVHELRKSNTALNVVALTATAGEMVKPDILSTLGLNEEDLVESGTSDRERFSYEVVSVEGSEGKDIALRQILQRSIPKSLRLSNMSSVLNHKNKISEKAVGLIFCIFADPHGQSTVKSGVSHYLNLTKAIIGDATTSTDPKLAYSAGRVRAFCSKKPSLCPKCFYYAYTSYRKGDSADFEADFEDEQPEPEKHKRSRQQCHNCQAIFMLDEAYRVDKWDSILYQNQQAFKQSDIDILVATKGFGMGIDKGSARFIVHTSLSAGMESWYQEAGRAGRDNERAHIVLLADLPNAACKAALETTRPVRYRPECSYLHGCPYGKAELCDYGKQHTFITGSYKGVEADLTFTLKFLAKAARGGISGNMCTAQSSNMYISQHEIGLHRLLVLGILKDFVVQYRQWPIFHILLGITGHEAVDQIRSNLSSNFQKYLDRYHTAGGESQQPAKLSARELLEEAGDKEIAPTFCDELTAARLASLPKPNFGLL